MHRYFVTGTDTDVGKTHVSAALARALRDAGTTPTIVKLVQTGVPGGSDGDAAHAGKLAGVPALELARFSAGADPWSAALAQAQLPLRAANLATALGELQGPLVVEGAGGLAVPLNESETLATVAQLAGLHAILVVGLRLGCMNHALLTIAHAESLGIPLAGAVLCERFGATDEAYHRDVTRTIGARVDVLGVVPFGADESESIARYARLFSVLVKGAAWSTY